MSEGKICKGTISHRFKFNLARDAIDLLTSDEQSLGIILQYEADRAVASPEAQTIKIKDQAEVRNSRSDPSVTFLGAGNYASRTLIPAFSKTGVNLETCVSMGASVRRTMVKNLVLKTLQRYVICNL